MKVIFLDIDGVLNPHTFNRESQSHTLEPHLVKLLNRILDETDAKIVISSSWRYMILNDSMTLNGFDYLLRTHGVKAGRIIGYTEEDDQFLGSKRSLQIQAWLDANQTVKDWVVIDDVPEGMDASPDPMRLVKTDGYIGLTAADADLAIGILNG